MAAALPPWVTPDHMTLLGLLAAVLVGLGYALSRRSPGWLMLAIVGLFLHWVGDSLDGTLARVRNRPRERYGYYVDRSADAVATLLILVGLAISPYVRAPVALVLTISYLLIQLHAEICAYTSGRFPLSLGRLGPTEARILLAGFTASLLFWRPPTFVVAGYALTLVDLALLAASGFFTVAFVVSTVVGARRLDRLDRSKWEES
jgi:phosphatidylglycerophosphate synthase